MWREQARNVIPGGYPKTATSKDFQICWSTGWHRESGFNHQSFGINLH
jgi:hypothetical protein